MSDKPKCPVFGCTIPRGIPHEHPAGVSAVMRDPAEPLSRYERMELEAYRRQQELEQSRKQSDALQAAYEENMRLAQKQIQELVSVMNAPWHQLAADIRAQSGTDDVRLRESIMRQNAGLQNAAPGSPLYDRAMGTNLHNPCRQSGFDGGEWLGGTAEPGHPSFVNSVGRFAFWMIVTVAAVIGLVLLSCVTGDQLSRWFS